MQHLVQHCWPKAVFGYRKVWPPSICFRLRCLSFFFFHRLCAVALLLSCWGYPSDAVTPPGWRSTDFACVESRRKAGSSLLFVGCMHLHMLAAPTIEPSPWAGLGIPRGCMSVCAASAAGSGTLWLPL